MAKNEASDSFACINELINLQESYCLNEDPNFTFQNSLLPDESLVLRSDADEELLLHIGFQETVRINSINLKAPADGSAPRTLKLYTNRTSMGFSDAYHIEATQVIKLSDRETESGISIPLRFVKFQSVNTLTLFIQGDEGVDHTVVSRFQFYGSKVDGTNMKDLKKMTEE